MPVLVTSTVASSVAGWRAARSGRAAWRAWADAHHADARARGPAPPRLADDQRYAKYFTMLRVGMPRGAVVMLRTAATANRRT